MVELPEVFFNHSFGKVGVDAGDQGLRTKMCYVDGIRSHRWGLKWVMHDMKVARSNSFKYWRELNKTQDGKEDKCAKWSTDGTRKGNEEWSHHVGLVKGLLHYTKQCKQCNPVETNETTYEEQQHTIANRGND